MTSSHQAGLTECSCDRSWLLAESVELEAARSACSLKFLGALISSLGDGPRTTAPTLQELLDPARSTEAVAGADAIDLNG